MRSSIFLPSSSFIRPADITAYSVGDLVANDTVAANVVVPSFDVSTRSGERHASIHSVRLLKSGTGIANASFRVHLFNAEPTAIVNGDNGAFSVSGVEDYLGRFDVNCDQAFGDGAWGSTELAAGVEPVFSEVSTLYWLLEAQGAYTPISGEVFTLHPEVRTL